MIVTEACNKYFYPRTTYNSSIYCPMTIEVLITRMTFGYRKGPIIYFQPLTFDLEGREATTL